MILSTVIKNSPSPLHKDFLGEMRGIVAKQQNLRETGCHWLRAGVTRFPENGLSKKARVLEIIKIQCNLI